MAISASPSSAFTGIIIGLVSSFGSIILIALIIFIFWVSGCAGSGRILLDRFSRPGEYDDEQAFAREEAEALETMDDMARTEYLRAKGTRLPALTRGILGLRRRYWALFSISGYSCPSTVWSRTFQLSNRPGWRFTSSSIPMQANPRFAQHSVHI
jgi:hypothetical protein